MIIKDSVTREQMSSLYLCSLLQASMEARRRREIPRDGGAGGCEPPDIGAGKYTALTTLQEQ